VSNLGVNSIPLGLGAFLQRLFSTFPSSWPGFGLLLFRLGVGIALIYLGISRLFGALGAPITVARDLIEAAGGIFLLAGLWTPVMGALIAIDELWIAFSLTSSNPDSRLIHIFFAMLTAGVAMLGPGAWSVDARLFGRKRFRMADRNRVRKPSL
jgi:putative oxidoreductase